MQLKVSGPLKKPKTFTNRLIRWTAYLLIAVVVINIYRAGKYSLYEYLDGKGFNRDTFYASPLSYTKSIINYLLESDKSEYGDIPTIAIDIKFKDWKKLEKNRRNALKRGLILKKEKEFIKASLRHNNQTIRAKVRLKGDLTDHLEGDKWSLRIKTKKNDHLFGMRSFSLQSPKTRSFLQEFLFLDMLRNNGVLAPRYLFVNEIINGNKIGVMALEEHFSKEILEANKRKESVIVKLDETLFWENKANSNDNSEPYHNYTAASISAFNSKKIKKSPLLQNHYRVAVGLLRSFIAGSLKASDVFDVELLGKYLAIVDTWGVGHAITWHNMRFAYNPYTAKLEPIGFDAGTGSPQPNVIPTETQKFAKRFLEDGYVRLAYIESIKKLNKKIHNSEFINEFNRKGSRYLSALRNENLFIADSQTILSIITKRSDALINKWANNNIIIVSIEDCNSNYINGWAVNTKEPSKTLTFNSKIKELELDVHADIEHNAFDKHNLSVLGLRNNQHGFSIDKKRFDDTDTQCPQIIYSKDKDKILISNKKFNESTPEVAINIPDNYITPVHVFLINNESHQYIEIDNIVPYEFTVSKITIHNTNNGTDKTLNLDTLIDIPAKVRHEVYDTINLDLSRYIEPNSSYIYTLALESKDNPEIVYNIDAKPYFSKLDKHPIPNASLTNLLKLHPYITLDKGSHQLNVQPGKHNVVNDIIIPAGYTLKISPSTILVFSSGVRILSFGNLISTGTQNSPVILKSTRIDKKWGGIVSIGNGSQITRLKNTLVSNTAAMQNKDWQLTGGITLYKNKYVDIDSCVFTNNSSEDFINIVHSNFSIKNTIVQSSLSDAFDADFSNGVISDSSFIDTGSIGGGDAVDISGSSVSIQNTTFIRTDDKAISVGEKSVLNGSHLTIMDSGTGIASKDGSKVYIDNSIIERSSIAGIMAYTKKKEYGSSFIDINNTRFKNNNLDTITQAGSTSIINGKTDKTVNLNVDMLYESLMKSKLK